MALGGLDEDGKNMYLVEIDGDILLWMQVLSILVKVNS